MKTLLLFLFLIPLTALSQTVITGKVVDVGGKPIANASVFLSNALAGTATTADGTFTLNNVKNGQYDMVISIIGYETHHQNITAAGANISLPTTVLLVKNNQLKEVKISPPDPNRNKYLALFTREFLGRSDNVPDCKIINPQILDLDYDKATNTLSASSDDFLIIENKALGYKIHYQLTHFTIRYDPLIPGSYSTYYDGNVFFENMPGSTSQKKKWAKKQLETYQGSAMHFLRSLFDDQWVAQGFKVMKLVRKINPARPPDSLLRVKMRKFAAGVSAHPGWQDSLQYYGNKLSLPKILEYLIAKPLIAADFFKITGKPDILALYYTDYLYVIYTKRNRDPRSTRVYHPLDMPDNPTSIIGLNTKFALFDGNGIFIDPNSTVFEGEWGKSGTADLLPVDYEPVAVN